MHNGTIVSEVEMWEDEGMKNTDQQITLEDEQMTKWTDIPAWTVRDAEESTEQEERSMHVGHWSRLGGTYWCDTCDSPYCDEA